MPATQNITVWQGDDHVIRITVKDDAGNAVDLAGASARWWAAKAVTSTADADIFIKKSSNDEITFDQFGGFWRVIVPINSADTEHIPASNNWYHECEVIDAVGDIITVTIGKFIVKPALIPNP